MNNDRRVGLRTANAGVGFILTLVCVSLTPLLCWSQEAPRTRTNLLADDQFESVLMLNSGRIVSGKIKQISTGYLVSSKAGYVAISRDEVRFVANTLGELYLMQKRELKDPTVQEQLKLAEWCVAQKLNAYAAKELLLVLERDPSNETARRLLARLDEHQSRTTGTSKAPLRDAGRVPKIADNEARSLSGLSMATADRFTSAVQPLLHNKCGNARCHNSNSEHEFRLSRGAPGAGNHRIHAERNLAGLLNYVNLDRPHESRLLKITIGAHAGQTLFGGRSGADQQRILTEWVMNAAKDLNPNAVVRPVAGGQAATPNMATVNSQPAAQRESNVGSTTPPKPLTDPEALLTEPEKSDFRKVVEASAADAFDPDKFNRQGSTP